MSLLLLPLLLNAQSECHYSLLGEVRDGESDMLLPGVALHLKEVNRAVTTNSQGEYTFDRLCAGEYTLEISFIGYKNIQTKIVLAKTAHRDFALHADSCTLESVTILHKKEETSTLQTAELSGKELQQTRGLSLGESLKSIPGVNAIQTGPTIFKPVIQGLYGYRIQIVNNGVKLESQQWGDDHAPEVDPFTSEKIKVVKGSASVHYGSDAMGGVVLMEPKALRKDPGINGEANLGAFSNGRTGVAALLLDAASKKITGLSMRVQGSVKQGGNTQAPGYYLDNTGLSEQNAGLTVRYEKKKWDLETGYSIYNTKIGVFSGSHPGNAKDLQEALNNSEPAVQPGFTYSIGRPYQKVTHQTVRLKGTYRSEKLGEIEFIAAYQDNNRKEFSLDRSFADIAKKIERPANTYKLNSLSAQIAYHHKPLKRITGTLGVSYLSQNNISGTTTGFLIVPNFTANNIGLFVSERWKKNRLELEAGIRYDIILRNVFRYVDNVYTTPSYTYQNASGTIGAAYRFHPNISAKLNVGTGFRAPALNEQFSRGLYHGLGIYVEGNANLKPERAFNTTLGVTYQKDKTLIELAVYNNIINDFIYLKPTLNPVTVVQGTFPAYQYTQTNAMLTGADLGIQQQLAKRLSATVKGSWLRGYNLTENDYLILMPPPRIDLGLKYTFATWKAFKDTYVGVNWLGVSKQNHIPATGDYAAPPAAYQLWSVQAGSTLRLGKQQVDVNLLVSNLFNERYREYLNFYRFYADELGRNIALRLNYKF